MRERGAAARRACQAVAKQSQSARLALLCAGLAKPCQIDDSRRRARTTKAQMQCKLQGTRTHKARLERTLQLTLTGQQG